MQRRIPNVGIPYTAFQFRLADNLKKYMGEKCITVRQLSEKSKVPPKTIYSYLRKEVSSPAKSNILAMSKALDISIGELLK